MISKRLKTISEMVMKNEVVFDCGSDHALLPCFLVTNGISPKVYAGDLREGPLNQAKQNIKMCKLEDRVIPVLSNGLEKMNNDVKVVTIAGMGYYTVEEILNSSDISNLKQVIIQVNRNVDKLREYISNRRYTIIDERVVYDGFYYEIVAFSPSETNMPLSDLEIKYGPVLLNKRPQEFIDYLNYRIRFLNEIYTKSHKIEVLNEVKEIEDIIKAT